MAALRVVVLLLLCACGTYPQAGSFLSASEGGTGGDAPGGDGGGSAGSGGSPLVEDCGTPGDEDGNGAADCDDAACDCPPPPPENCATAVDEDGDGLGGCDDPDCAGACQDSLEEWDLGEIPPNSSMTVDLPDGLVGFTAVARRESGAFLRFRSVISPAGVELLQAGLRTELGQDAVGLVLPASDDPDFVTQGGAWTFGIESDSPARFTLALRRADPAPRILDLDVYLPQGLRACARAACSGGSSVVSAADAADFAELEGIVATFFDAAYGPAGFTRGDVRYYDLPSSFVTINSEEELTELYRASGIGRPRALQVMLVQQFFLAEIAGIAANIPGALGAVGTRGAAVAVQVQLDGSTDRNLGGLVLAHEAGHLLGLYHTTEADGSSDIVGDTPTCPGITTRPDRCPDLSNPMFPFLNPTFDAFTAGQILPLRAGPLHHGVE